MKPRLFLPLLLLLLCVTPSLAKNEPNITMLWPSGEKPALKLVFSKFQQLYSAGNHNTYVTDVTIENLTDKVVPRAVFTVYLMDKTNIRIGDGFLQVSDIDPGQQVKVPFQFTSIGIPSKLELSAKRDMLVPKVKTVSLKVISVPAGAKLKVDGEDGGVTPKMLSLAVGTHNLEFSKDGYATGSTPVEITPDELSGGSITFELGGISRDTVELRDGTVILGDAISLTMESIVLRVEGKEQTYNRNQVKKILLVEREINQQPPVVQHLPATTQK